MQVGMVCKKMFFDTPAVKRRVDKATRRVLSKFGAYVRTAARSSIRRRKRTSDPGQPPSSHLGLLRKIYFGFDPQRESVVIGPTPLHGRGYRNALEALEHGGTFTRYSGGRRRRRAYRATYRPRPFMGPAFEAEKPKLPAMWRDSIK